MYALTDLPNFPRPCIVFASENLSERVCTHCRPRVCQCIVLFDSHSLIKAIGEGRAKTNVHPQNRLVNNSHLSQNPKFAQFFQSVNLNLQKCNSESALELDRVLSFLLQHPDRILLSLYTRGCSKNRFLCFVLDLCWCASFWVLVFGDKHLCLHVSLYENCATKNLGRVKIRFLQFVRRPSPLGFHCVFGA